jgi:glycosyltransferase involved in cell wall biosynthesis
VRIYWYWPHPHPGASPFVLATRRDGDLVTVQAQPARRGGLADGTVDQYRVVRDLPDPTRFGHLPSVMRQAVLAEERSRARRRLLREGFDVAHIGVLTYQVDWLDLRTLRAKPPVVANVHDVRPHRSRWPRPLKALYGPAVADVLVVFHEVLRDELVADYGVDGARVAVVPLPFPADDTTTGAGLDTEAPHPGRPVYLFFGALRENKGVRTLLDAAHRLGADPGFDLVVAGTGDPDLERAVVIAAEQIPWLTARVGTYISDRHKRELFERASLVVLPYRTFHSQSGVLTDAYRHGLPLVVTSVGALGVTVSEDGTGWVVAPDDPDALADALIRAGATDLAPTRERVRTAARRHDVAVVGPQLRRILDQAVAAAGSGRG